MRYEVPSCIKKNNDNIKNDGETTTAAHRMNTNPCQFPLYHTSSTRCRRSSGSLDTQAWTPLKRSASSTCNSPSLTRVSKKGQGSSKKLSLFNTLVSNEVWNVTYGEGGREGCSASFAFAKYCTLNHQERRIGSRRKKQFECVFARLGDVLNQYCV